MFYLAALQCEHCSVLLKCIVLSCRKQYAASSLFEYLIFSFIEVNLYNLKIHSCIPALIKLLYHSLILSIRAFYCASLNISLLIIFQSYTFSNNNKFILWVKHMYSVISVSVLYSLSSASFSFYYSCVILISIF